MTQPARSFRVGVDIGGTFTDVIVTSDSGRSAVAKLLSTPDDYSRGVLDGMRSACAEIGLPPSLPGEVIHATTIATNAILQRLGADCALITTTGFRDVLEIGRLRLPQLYNLFYERRPPLIPRRHVFEVQERIGSQGEVLTPLDPGSVAAAVAGVRDSGVQSVALCLFNSYANPAHEHALAAAIRAALPSLEVSVSADILPHIKEYERTSTTVIDAYVKPVVRRYLHAFRRRLDEDAFRAPLLIMQCGGGLTTAERAAQEPVTLVESGPAAGVLAAQAMSADWPNLVTFDMGGTTAKASIIESGRVLKTSEYEVGAEISATTRLTGGGGYSINIPVIDVAEVGSGGGSIAWIDTGGSLRVGPLSSGAEPGPACYGRGGERPTVTDANVLLGYLNPEAIAGGAIAIDHTRAEIAIRDHLCRPLGLDPVQAAHGVHLIANSEMMGAIRAVSTSRGRDVREFALIAFGGSGPLHAVELARATGIRTVVVPPLPGLFSAVGLLTTALEFTRSRMVYRPTAGLDLAVLNQMLHGLWQAVAGLAAREVAPDAGALYTIEADLHYWGQSHELTVTRPYAPLDAAGFAALVEAFEREHATTYGHRAEGEQVILVALRVVARVPSGATAGPIRGLRTKAASRRPRRAYFGPGLGFVETPVIGRDDLVPAARPGPLLIEEYDSVTVVPPGSSVRRDGADRIVVAVGQLPGT